MSRPGQPTTAAGRRPDPEMLIDVDRLVGAYYDEHPDPSDPSKAVSFGTSGHRGSSLHGHLHRGPHPRHQRGDRPLPIGGGHRRARSSSAATRTRCRSPHSARRSRCWWRTASTWPSTPRTATRQRRRSRTRSSSTTRARSSLADGIVITPSHNPPEDGGFKYNPPHGGPADTDVTRQIQDTANELLREGLRGVKRESYEQAAPARARLRLPQVIRGRPAAGRAARCAGGRRAAARRRPARRRQRGLLGCDRHQVPARSRGRERQGRPDLLLHAARPRRQDPHGLLVARRDGGPDLAQGPLRRGLRQRPRRRPPRDRDPQRRPPEPEPLPGGGDLLPVGRLPARLESGLRRGQDDGLEQHHRPGGRRARAAARGGAGGLQVVRVRACSTAAWPSAARRAPAQASSASTAAPGPPTRMG